MMDLMVNTSLKLSIVIMSVNPKLQLGKWRKEGSKCEMMPGYTEQSCQGLSRVARATILLVPIYLNVPDPKPPA